MRWRAHEAAEDDSRAPSGGKTNAMKTTPAIDRSARVARLPGN
jgi:hypothetical protein